MSSESGFSTVLIGCCLIDGVVEIDGVSVDGADDVAVGGLVGGEEGVVLL